MNARQRVFPVVAVVGVLVLGSACRYVPPPTAPSAVIPNEPTPRPTVIVAPSNTSTPPAAVTINIDVFPTAPRKGDPVTFTVVAGNVGSNVTYAWNFGDGTAVSGSETTRTHVFTSDGLKQIRVTATDGQGRSGSGFREIVIPSDPPPPPPPIFVPPPPTPPPSPPSSPSSPTLSATMSCTPATHGSQTPCNVSVTYGGQPLPSADVTRVDWDWGDGENTAHAGVVASHPYAIAGSYTVVAEITADTADGSKRTTTSRQIVVP